MSDLVCVSRDVHDDEFFWAFVPEGDIGAITQAANHTPLGVLVTADDVSSLLYREPTMTGSTPSWKLTLPTDLEIAIIRVQNQGAIA